MSIKQECSSSNGQHNRIAFTIHANSKAVRSQKMQIRIQTLEINLYMVWYNNHSCNCFTARFVKVRVFNLQVMHDSVSPPGGFFTVLVEKNFCISNLPSVTLRNGNFLLECLDNFYGKFLSMQCRVRPKLTSYRVYQNIRTKKTEFPSLTEFRPVLLLAKECHPRRIN